MGEKAPANSGVEPIACRDRSLEGFDGIGQGYLGLVADRHCEP